jgi:hypothetical protein
MTLWHNVWGQRGLGNRECRGDRDLALDQVLEQLARPTAEQVARINVFQFVDTSVE